MKDHCNILPLTDTIISLLWYYLEFTLNIIFHSSVDLHPWFECVNFKKRIGFNIMNKNSIKWLKEENIPAFLCL